MLPRFFLLALAASLAIAQDSSSVSGSVVDSTGAPLPSARLTLFDLERRTTSQALTNDAGIYAFHALLAGDYTITVTKEGFQDFRVQLLHIRARDTRNLRVEMTAGTAGSTTVTVTPRLDGLTTDFSNGISLEHAIASQLPVNGRNIDSLVALTPGISSASANGLGTHMNFFTLDGINVPSTPTSTGQSNLIALDALSELRVQTLAVAPEYGRSPGAQVAILSRAGTNTFHGSLFGLFRNQRFNANDWFANRAGLDRGQMRQNHFGGTFGGALIPNRTFFFAALEQNRISAPQTLSNAVPSLATRQSAPANLRQYLNAFPLPTSELLSGGAAQFTAVTSNPADMRSASVRIDHTLRDNMRLFARYAITPSSADTRGLGINSANTITSTDQRNEMLTGSWFWQRSDEASNDLRVNFTRTRWNAATTQDSFGGAVPLASTTGAYTLQINGLGAYTLASATAERMRQINVVDAYSITSGTHHYKMGFEYRRQALTQVRPEYTALVTFNGLGATSTTGFLSARAANAVFSTNTPVTEPLFNNYSAYWQDTWQATDRATITYGVRWDINPAPKSRTSTHPFALNDDGTYSQTQRLYKTTWYNFAPRLGLAYMLDDTPGKEMMFRSGVGMFYDVNYAAGIEAFSAPPFSSMHLVSNPAFPLAGAYVVPPTLPATSPYGQISSVDSRLLAPRIIHWQLALERNFGRHQSFSAGYIGTSGRRLTAIETSTRFNDLATSYNDATIVRNMTNSAASDFHGMTAQYRARFADRLDLRANYTWSHAIDSTLNNPGSGFQHIILTNRGNSSFDVRHNVNVSGSYRLPSAQSAWMNAATRDWHLDFIATSRTGLPYDVQAQTTAPSALSSTSTRIGFYGQGRPNYNGQALYIDDPNVAGGRRLNLAAFTTPTDFVQGTLGSNVLRGLGLNQVDLTLRRDVPLTERFRLQFRVEAYNLLNHANFANPSLLETANMASSNFGVTTRMTGSQLYGNGGPRSMQASLRLFF